MKKPVRFKDIAAVAGVTTATVSLALSGKPGPSADTRRKIEGIARALGYRKDPYSAILAANRRRDPPQTAKAVLAFITAHRTRDSWSESANFAIYHHAAKARAAELGYRVENFWVGLDATHAQRVSHILYNRGIQGLLIAPLPDSRNGFDLAWKNFHSVALGFSFTRPFLNRVSCDHFQAVRTAVGRCYKLGYRRIGLVVTRGSNERVDQRWLAAYLLEQKQFVDAVSLPPLMMEHNEDHLFFNWLDRENPDVVLAYAGDLFLPKVIESGRRVPEEIGFVSLNLPDIRTGISGIYENPDRIGTEAVDLLVAGLDSGERGIPDHPNTFLTQPSWIPGDTLKNDISAGTSRIAASRASTSAAKTVSMRDVAEFVGLHPATISLALQKHPRIPLKTRERIQNAANELGYRKNPLIAKLMQRRRGRVKSGKRPGLAFLTTFSSRDGWKNKYPLLSQYYLGARDRAEALGFAVTSAWLKDPANATRLWEDLAARDVQGIIIPPFAPNVTDLQLDWDSFCHVSVGFAPEFPRLHRVATDTYRSMKKAILESIRRGYHRIGLASPSTVTRYTQDTWLASFLMQLHEFSDRLIPRYHFFEDGNPRALREWLDRDSPDLILTPRADELLKHLSEWGFRIPEDIALVSLDRQPGDPLSGIDQNGMMLGSRAVDLLVKMVEKNEYGIPKEPTTQFIDGKWYAGESTRPIRVPETQSKTLNGPGD